MRMLFSSANLEELASVKKLLTRAEIPCQIINDAKTPAMLKLALYPELWIEQDEDFLAASVLLASWRRDMPATFMHPAATPSPAAPRPMEISPL